MTRPVVTLTLNPAIDAACVADEVVPMRKVRTRDERYDPGGGGLNVARVIRELGGEAVAFYLAGGITGQALEGLVERGGIAAVRVPIQDLTRVSHTVFETSTGQEFRFTPEGPSVTEAEWQNCLEVLSVVDADYFVASGSLARGLPSDFYARVARQAKARGSRVIVDSSGPGLAGALAEGVFLVKPSRRELAALLGRDARTPADEEALAREVVDGGQAEVVALTLGAEGAVLATRDQTLQARQPAGRGGERRGRRRQLRRGDGLRAGQGPLGGRSLRARGRGRRRRRHDARHRAVPPGGHGAVARRPATAAAGLTPGDRPAAPPPRNDPPLRERPEPGAGTPWLARDDPASRRHTWRSTGPEENANPGKYPDPFRLKPEDLARLPVVPTIPPLRRS